MLKINKENMHHVYINSHHIYSTYYPTSLNQGKIPRRFGYRLATRPDCMSLITFNATLF